MIHIDLLLLRYPLYTLLKMYQIYFLLLSFNVLFVSCITYPCGNSSATASNDWDYLTFSQHWPPSFCISVSDQNNKCVIPSDVKTWTIHGLWPSLENGTNPEYCYSPQMFNDSTITPLVKQLNQTWPNLILENPFTVFWQHEWCKHGTCGENTSAINGELNYFQKGIDLHNNLSLTNVLESGHILPGRNYSLSNINSVLFKAFNVTTKVLCFYNKEQVVLQQVEICYNKNFTLRNCPGSTQKRLTNLGNCSSKKDIYYPPLNEYSFFVH
ncbi:ribonuclease Oy-like [Antedon mediterranea]|uniref:ribonuclease Oy-like n=1 Tax=Antedon mediterranea TaxID=105859 RepID=UPI003AF69AD5